MAQEEAQKFLKEGGRLYREGKYQLALESFDKALAINPQLAVLWSNRGAALSDLGRHQEALESDDKALAINPQYAVAWYNRGVALGRLGRHQEALESDDKALAINPQLAVAWSNRGNALSDLGRHQEALESFDKALAINPQDAVAWLHRGLCLTELKRHQRALASIEKSLRYNPASAWTWLFHGNVLFELGKHLQSLDSFDRAIDLRNGDFPEVWKCKQAALGLIKVLLEKHLPPKPHLEAYELVTWVEERLHIFIRQRLQQALGEEETRWWHRGVPQPIRKKCAERLEEDPRRRPLYRYTDLIDLKDIMDKNWRHFENDFRKAEGHIMSKKDFLDNLARLNEIRKNVMHPVRGDITEEDLAFARQMKSVVESMTPSG